MRDAEIHIGDVLRIRSWDDMAAEFGVDEETGEIPCADTFTPYMKMLCGLTFTVRRINTYGSAPLDYDAEEPDFDKWLISADMLEPIAPGVPDEEIELEEPDTLFGFLFS